MLYVLRAQGFMCRECAEGQRKIGGKCIVCDKFSWFMPGQTLMVNFLIALALLHKSTRATVSYDELALVWNKVDIHKTGEYSTPVHLHSVTLVNLTILMLLYAAILQATSTLTVWVRFSRCSGLATQQRLPPR